MDKRLRILLPLLLVSLPLVPALAQSVDSLQTARAEEVLTRIKRHTASDVLAARVLADSLVGALPDASAVLPEALFAKASIAPSAAEAERDYARIVNDHRFAARVPDALMRLALLESARNNRVGALRHLDRLLRNHSDAAVRSRASLLAGRIRLDLNDPARACELFAAAHASAGATERDVRDQAETLGARCPTPVAVMAQREPPPLGVARASAEARATTGAAVVATATGNRRARRDAATTAPAVATPPIRSESPTVVRTAPSVVRRDTVVLPVKPVPVVRRDTVVLPVKPVPVVRRDTVVLPVKPSPVVRRDTVALPAKPVPAARRDTVALAVTTVPVVTRRDTQPPVRTAPVMTRRDTTVPLRTAPGAVSSDSAARNTGARYGVQFAAYNDRPGAEQFASILRSRGIIARVEGTTAPFRVRVGRFTTRAEAEASAALWRRPGQPTIVVALSPAP